MLVAAFTVLACRPLEESTPAGGPAAFVGSAACAQCHAEQAARWAGSHHARAMQIANEKSVLGDFDDARLQHLGSTSRFFRRDGKPFVSTEGADGISAEFEIRYTFGLEPLQQYLIEAPGGRLQSLAIAWDSERRRWFHLYPGERIDPGDPLHWTGRYQSWNAMCADCHSTGLRKGYDLETDGYQTRWAEISVGCEACHGPGEEHLAWARAGRVREGTPAREDGLLVRLAGSEARTEVESCAPCHARRSRIRDEESWHGRPFLDDFLPVTLREGLYHADGQIDGEVYEHGSFLQSRMYQRGVRCSDCHEPHSARLRAEGNALCTRCHQEQPDARFPTLRSGRYDTPEHHFHDKGSTGAECVACHMPSRTYMIVDPRRDHSLRVPRPDLSERLGTPNACNACHADRSPRWAAEALAHWFGRERRREPHFGAAIHAARSGAPGAEALLRALAVDVDQPAIARASALELLSAQDAESLEVLARSVRDPDAWVRTAAAGALDRAPGAPRLELAAPLLEDPVRAVRIEAARVLAPLAADLADAALRERLERALREFEDAQRAQADLPGAHLNLGVVHAGLGRVDQAELDYRTAIRLDAGFLPARVNLANLLNALGRNADAERELRDAIASAPQEGELHYSLGLLLAEEGRLDAAASSLGRAAALLPTRARVRYNHALALRQLGQLDAAEAALLEARALDPGDADVARALALLQGRRSAAPAAP